MNRAGSELHEHLGEAQGEAGYPVPFERGVLRVAEAVDAVAVERRGGVRQIESPPLHLDQVLDHVGHRVALGLHEQW